MKSKIWLIGASVISQNYFKVLKALKQPVEVIGRGESTAKSFYKATRHKVKVGGLNLHLKKSFPHTAIVTVGVEELFDTTKNLIKAGTKRILLEKPGSINLNQIKYLESFARINKSQVYVAYNRRFYSSVNHMKKLINKDGGILSMNFEFTEIINRVKPYTRPRKVRERWLIANSHVIDLAFHLSSKPKYWKCWHKGRFNWHPTSARFCGSGITRKGVMFSYLSDWESPGSWGLELMTAKRRFILKPLEQLKVIQFGSKKIKNIKFQNKIDKNFKPGLYKQTKNFIEKDTSLFCTLSEQIENMKIFFKVAGY